MSYRDEEKSAAAARIVSGTPQFRRTSLATRDSNYTYEQVAELIKTSLLYEPDAVFYLIYLSCCYYKRSVVAASDIVDDLLDAIDDLAMPNRPIPSVASIDDAARALEGVSEAMTRSGTLSGPSMARFQSSILSSQSALGQAVKQVYTPRGESTPVIDIVRPRDEARRAVQSAFSSLKEVHAGILDAVSYLLSSYEEFVAANLRLSVASPQVQRAAEDLRSLHDDLSVLTPKARIEKARDGLLRVLAAKSAVSSLASTRAPGEPRIQADAANPFYRATAYGTGTPPTISGTIASPWPLRAGYTDILEIAFGIGSPVSVDLVPGSGWNPGVSRAVVVAGKKGPYRIGPDLSTPHELMSRLNTPAGSDFNVGGTTLYFIVDGVRYEVAFPTDLNASEIASAINSAIPTVTASAGFSPPDTDYVVVAWDNTSDPPDRYSNRFMTVTTGVDNADDLGAWRTYDGNPGTTSRGWDATNELWVKANDATAHTVVSLTAGSWPTYSRTATQVATDITSYGGSSFEGATDQDRVCVRSEVYGEGSIVTILSGGASGSPAMLTDSQRTIEELGFYQYQESRRDNVSVLTVVDVLQKNTNFAQVATADSQQDILVTETGATVGGVANELSIPCATDPTTDSRWVLSEMKLTILGGDNRGVYGMTSATWAAGTLTVRLDRSLRDQTVTHRHKVSIYKEYLRITAKSSAPQSYIDVNQAATNTAHAVIGLPTDRTYGTVEQLYVEEYDNIVGWRAADLRKKGIKVGDLILNGSGQEVASVTGITYLENGVIDVEPIAPTVSLTAFSIVAAAKPAYEEFHTALGVWELDITPYQDANLRAIDRVVAPVLLLETPSQDQIDAAYSTVAAYKTKVTALVSVLSDYYVSKIGTVDDVLKTLLENGHDRARTLLLQARFADFFDVTSRTASYGRTMMDAGSNIVVQDLNESTFNRRKDAAVFERIRSVWIEDVNPALEIESEIELPSVPLEDYWPGSS